MLTEKDYCDYDTCVVLKELGFDDNVDWYFYPPSYKKDGQEGCWLCWGIPPMISEEQEQEYIPRVSLYEAQKWLREEKRLLILPDYNSFGWFCGIHYPVNSVKMFKYTAKEVNSYEEALSEGIKEAVKILKENETIRE